jgi:hypothetical protein
MSYSLKTQTIIIFGNLDENTYPSDEHVIKQNETNTWQRFRKAFWFIGKSSACIYAKYPMETERVKLTHKIINGKFHIYYHPKYEKDMIIKYEGQEIKVGSNLKLSDSKFISDADYVHVFV